MSRKGKANTDEFVEPVPLESEPVVKLSPLLQSIKNLFDPESGSRFDFEGGLVFLLPERQQNRHKITIRKIVLCDPTESESIRTKCLHISLEREVKQARQTIEFCLKVTRSNDQLLVQARSGGNWNNWVETLTEEIPNQVGFGTTQRTKGGGEYYDDVMSYWFGEMPPEINIEGKTIVGKASHSEFNEYFRNLLWRFWPKYDYTDKPPWFVTCRIDTNDSEDNSDPDLLRTVWIIAVILLAFLRRFIINGICYDSKFKGSKSKVTKELWGPAKAYLLQDGKYKPESFAKKPDVDLNPSALKKYLRVKKLYFEPALLDTICGALNSGDNVILTGGPGCGKTSLAKEIIDFSDYEGIVATASSAWTTDELIGRYMPKPYATSTVLSFHPGFFMEAIRDKKWLLIDEMNRAPIDLCFGELFTVLAGQSVELPFFKNDGSDGNKRVWIVAKNDKAERVNIVPYKVDPSFRLLCTMNDVDKDKLEQLSFALQRRFHIIRVDSPSNHTVQTIISDYWSEYTKKVKNGDNGLTYLFQGKEQKPEVPQEALKTLFYNGEDDLLSLHIISVAQVIDILKFALRRCYVSKVGYEKKLYKGINVNHYILTGLALGIVTKVYPQLQNFLHNDEVIKKVIHLLVHAFGGEKKMVFASENKGELILVYLKNEFELQFKSLSHANYRDDWPSQQC